MAINKRNNFNDLTGEKYGRFSVIGFDSIKGHMAYWKCQCDCGVIKSIRGSHLISGAIKSCGCFHRERTSEVRRLDLKGQRFGRLTILSFAYLKNGMTHWNCQCDCGGKKIVSVGNLRNSNTQSCGCLHSEICREKIKKQHKSGKDNPSYNPELTDKERIIRRKYPEYIEWRIAVFERDNYTCQCCGKRGTDLIAHHLNGHDNFRELRILLENGITLCKDCHNNFHHQYGYGNNTEKQFEQFLAQREEEFSKC